MKSSDSKENCRVIASAFRLPLEGISVGPEYSRRPTWRPTALAVNNPQRSYDYNSLLWHPFLSALGGVDAVQSDPLAVNFDGIAIDDRGRTRAH